MVAGLEQLILYTFEDAQLLRCALSRVRGVEGYQRLEFLGDRVLGLVVGDWLFSKYSQADEGELSRRLTFLVRESTLAGIARRIKLNEFIKLSPGEVMNESILADAVEAVLGAIWLDGGLEAARDFVRREWADLIDTQDKKDGKTRLQEWLQGQGMPLPEYVVVEERGPDHDKYFKVQVNTAAGEALGEGRSKQAAGLQAADNLMKRLEK